MRNMDRTEILKESRRTKEEKAMMLDCMMTTQVHEQMDYGRE